MRTTFQSSSRLPPPRHRFLSQPLPQLSGCGINALRRATLGIRWLLILKNQFYVLFYGHIDHCFSINVMGIAGFGANDTQLFNSNRFVPFQLIGCPTTTNSWRLTWFIRIVDFLYDALSPSPYVQPQRLTYSSSLPRVCLLLHLPTLRECLRLRLLLSILTTHLHFVLTFQCARLQHPQRHGSSPPARYRKPAQRFLR